MAVLVGLLAAVSVEWWRAQSRRRLLAQASDAALAPVRADGAVCR
jgi:hypothetical protein